MTRHGSTACFILLVYTELVFGQQLQNGELIHTPQDRVKDNSTAFDMEELEQRIIEKVTKDFETQFRTCKALETGLGLEIRLEALEHIVANLVNTSGLKEETDGGLAQGNGTNPSTSAISCPAGFTEFESHCYMVNTARAKWHSARKSCQALNSDLVSINNQDEQRFLVDLINMNYSTGFYANYWMGLMDTVFGDLIWVDGSTPVYTEWGEAHEPNCMTKSNCKGAAFLAGVFNFKWEDAMDAYRYRSICEVDMTTS